MPLYTFIAEYRGGTYVQQLRGDDPGHALRKYAADANWVSKTQKRAFLSVLLEDCSLPITEVDETVGVWCVSQSFRGTLLLVTIVETYELVGPRSKDRIMSVKGQRQ